MAEFDNVPPAGGNQTEGDGALNTSIISEHECLVKHADGALASPDVGNSDAPGEPLSSADAPADAIPAQNATGTVTPKVGDFLDAVARRMAKNSDDDFDKLAALFDGTEAADDLAPIPAGTYPCRIDSGELGQSKNGTPCYKLVFAIQDGEYQGRRIRHSVWLSASAMPYAKRELRKLGILTPAELKHSPKPGLVCLVRVVNETSNSGDTFTKVRSFEVIGIESADDDAFAPGSSLPGGGQ